MSMLEVDLLDKEGVIQSVASVDNIFWETSGDQARAMAQERGLDLHAPGGPADPGAAEREVRSMTGMIQWLATMHGELTIKHGKKGEVVITHSPHGEVGAEFLPVYRRRRWHYPRPSLGADPRVSYGVEFSDEFGDDTEVVRHHHHRHHHHRHHHLHPAQVPPTMGAEVLKPIVMAGMPSASKKKEGFFKRVIHAITSAFHGEGDDEIDASTFGTTPPGKRSTNVVASTGGYASSWYIDGNADFPYAPLIAGEQVGQGHPVVGTDFGCCPGSARGSIKG